MSERSRPQARTALVTGANRGIGLEVCRQLASAGHSVVLAARDPSRGEQAARALRDQGLEVRVERLDVADESSVRACARRLAADGVEVDVLVNNASTYPQTPVLELSTSELDEVLRTNLHASLWTCQAFLPGMLARGFGRVVNVSSGYGSFADGLSSSPPAYGIAKVALNALTVVLARAMRGDVKINCVDPGWVRTRMGGPHASRSVEEGAAGVVWLATLPRDGPNGEFFHDRRRTDW